MKQHRITGLLSAILTVMLMLSCMSAAFAEETLPFEEYGAFTDPGNEQQLRRRASWFYETFIADPEKWSTGKNAFSIEQIMDDIRLMNGEFMTEEDGSIRYNDVDVIAVANDLHTIGNYDSLAHYGTQIFFTPTAPLFLDGSRAQQDAIAIDRAMERVVAAIRENDDEGFVAAAREWGGIVLQIFKYADMTGEYVSVYQVGAAQGFFLFHAMNSKFASTILEHSERRNLQVMIPDSAGPGAEAALERPLVDLIHELNEQSVRTKSVRTEQGELLQEYYSLPEDLCILAKDYFNSRLDREQAFGGDTTGTGAETRADGPGKADLTVINSRIEFPREGEYLARYEYAVVKAPKGHSVYGYGSADRAGHVYYVRHEEPVTILARRGGMSCCIVPAEGVARWINSDYLELIEAIE